MQWRTYILARPGGSRGGSRRLKDFILFQKCRVGFCIQDEHLAGAPGSDQATTGDHMVYNAWSPHF